MAFWELLMEGQIILRAVGHPAVLTVKQAVKLTKLALRDDVLFDTKRLRRLLALSLRPEAVPADEVLRTLGVLESLDDPHRRSMTLLKFSKFPDSRVQSKAGKILGGSVESVAVMDELFLNRDGRVRANLMEGLGHGGSDALLRMRANSKMQEIRRSAEFARRIATGESSGRDANGVEIAAESETALLPEVNTLGVVDSEPAVNASVEEVHSEA